MTVKGTKELLTGDTATLVARALIILGLTWNGLKQETTKENTEDIKITLSTLRVKQDAIEQRISRNEILDGNDHSYLRQMVDRTKTDLDEFKQQYYYEKKHF